MRILTFGWEFPPLKNGGLGVACQGLTEELIEAGIEIVFVLPYEQDTVGQNRFVFANLRPSRWYAVKSYLRPYLGADDFVEVFDLLGRRVRIPRRIIDEVRRYADSAATIAAEEEFDLIHAHDWMSYLAGIAAKRVSGKPLILHVHATSFDQAGGDHADPEIYQIEWGAFHEADSIIAISNYTKRMIVDRYGVAPEKVEVIHNGIKPVEVRTLPPMLAELRRQGKKIVSYHGRITIQKGVDHFIRAARRVVDVDPHVVFVISGWGDMQHQIIHLVGSLGLSDHVIFTGALWDEERDRLYQSSDLLVMPSVSEPFGLVPLESIQQGTPALISKQSGVSEVLTHVLKVDFWDTEEMANKILAALRYDPLRTQLRHEGLRELGNVTWKRAAEKVMRLYQKLLAWTHDRTYTK